MQSSASDWLHWESEGAQAKYCTPLEATQPHPRVTQALQAHFPGSARSLPPQAVRRKPQRLSDYFPSSAARRVNHAFRQQRRTPRVGVGNSPAKSQTRDINPVGRGCWVWKPAAELCTMTETLFPFHSKFVFCRAGCPVYIPLRTKNGHLLTSTWADSPKLQTPGLGLQDREGQ